MKTFGFLLAACYFHHVDDGLTYKWLLFCAVLVALEDSAFPTHWPRREK